MITFKIFMSLVYIVYLIVVIVTCGSLLVSATITINKENQTKLKSKFVIVMFMVDHSLLLYVVVNYIRFLIGR